MSLLDRGGGAGEEYIECRNCGTAVDDVEQACPTCGREEMVVYRY